VKRPAKEPDNRQQLVDEKSSALRKSQPSQSEGRTQDPTQRGNTPLFPNEAEPIEKKKKENITLQAISGWFGHLKKKSKKNTSIRRWGGRGKVKFYGCVEIKDKSTSDLEKKPERAKNDVNGNFTNLNGGVRIRCHRRRGSEKVSEFMQRAQMPEKLRFEGGTLN